MNKKAKYLIYSFILTALIYVFSVVPVADRLFIFGIILTILFIGNFLTQHPFVKWTNYVINLIPPVSLAISTILALIFFPNLSVGFKLLGILFFGVLLYTYLLINNIFLVVAEKREVIPLYRAAVTWSEIILIIMAIPLYAGIFKLGVGFVSQAIIAGLIGVFFTIYVLWTLLLDKDAKKVGYKEGSVLFFVVFYLIMGSRLAVSFLQTESFLTAILISVILMFCLSYIQGHLKNSITKELITQFFIIFAIFLLVLFLYLP